MNKVIDYNIYKATILIGLQRGYTNELIEEEMVLDELKKLQDMLIKTERIYLSANCFLSKIVLSGQQEPHLNLQFINYPKFPLSLETFKSSVEIVAESLMNKFDQNRIVIQFHDANVMLENGDDIDPKIIR